jgi:hypothetical protein
VTDHEHEHKQLNWPGAVALLGIMAFGLLLIWTAKGVLPWQ